MSHDPRCLSPQEDELEMIKQIGHYRDYLILYADMIAELSRSQKHIQRLVIGKDLSPFEQTLRNHIEQFRKE
ncbi:hypothetical protein [Agarilytica rhodophyticola]|uniref:hypothetical protein n=1 Tax=Agarilytica rhodophyticola TaxID=1737490 RepID=UPI000B34954F|nr:hypothetical protein [Agarilytica rhodophyticola]